MSVSTKVQLDSRVYEALSGTIGLDHLSEYVNRVLRLELGFPIAGEDANAPGLPPAAALPDGYFEPTPEVSQPLPTMAARTRLRLAATPRDLYRDDFAPEI